MAVLSELFFASDIAAEHPQWRWYAIADSAQSRQLPAALLEAGTKVRCLLGAEQGTPLAAQSPHLVSLPTPDVSSAAWRWIDLHARRSSSVTVIASLVEFDELYAHMRQFVEARLPDGDTMFFAFWDPAILGTLLGQPDDATLHVRGPVLTAEQHDALFRHIDGWWYWDRDGVCHRCTGSTHLPEQATLPLQLTQGQVDDLVEASVPDHVLYYLDLNQPLLLAEVPPVERYRVVRSAIQEGRGIGLTGMQDLVNYVCAVLIYKERLHQDDDIRNLLLAVKNGRLSFSQALEELP